MSAAMTASKLMEQFSQLPIELAMAAILVSILIVIGFVTLIQSKRSDYKESATFLAHKSNPIKREFETWALIYTGIWIASFGVVVVQQLYETFTADSYMKLCVSLALPYLLQPIVYPLPSERHLPLFQRYSFKANVWIAIFSFIGNYWYTHYFYTVLKARYTFPAHRLNDVPIALFFATHFYFVTYHTFSNIILRSIESRFKVGWRRTLLFWLSVLAFSYFTAFMETLTISSFPYYSFENRYMAYTLGSAFYGIYFIVSFPTFYRVDEGVVGNGKTTPFLGKPVYSLYQTIMEALGCSMLVLCLLDFCRIYFGIELNISGVAYYLYQGIKK